MKKDLYRVLYDLQDRVLELVFSEASGFYLTGGTALGRFYLNHRYSDDLDFFSHDLHAFPEIFRLLHDRLLERWSGVSLEVDARDFKRIRIIADGATLKLDFVADRVSRIGLPVRIQNVYVDTVRNILSNKICAVLGRDEGRDIADLVWIARKRRFTWPDILEDAQKKELFEPEDFCYRISSFPIELLDTVPFIDVLDRVGFEAALQGIKDDVEHRDVNHEALIDAIDL
ncbi:MAG: nucleotidyl transferase AbiEii/AbiGii toxin family protein [Spirochaetota bacterium]